MPRPDFAPARTLLSLCRSRLLALAGRTAGFDLHVAIVASWGRSDGLREGDPGWAAMLIDGEQREVTPLPSWLAGKPPIVRSRLLTLDDGGQREALYLGDPAAYVEFRDLAR